MNLDSWNETRLQALRDQGHQVFASGNLDEALSQLPGRAAVVLLCDCQQRDGLSAPSASASHATAVTNGNGGPTAHVANGNGDGSLATVMTNGNGNGGAATHAANGNGNGSAATHETNGNGNGGAAAAPTNGNGGISSSSTNGGGHEGAVTNGDGQLVWTVPLTASSVPADPLSDPGAEIVVDEGTYEARLNGRVLSISATEFRLLCILVKSAPQVVGQGQLLSDVWGDEYMGDPGILRLYIHTLRRKLCRAGGEANWIRNVPSVGYSFQGQPAD